MDFQTRFARHKGTITKLAVVAICVAGIAYFAHVLDGYTPLRTWLFWYVLRIWAWEALWVAGCLAAGDLVVSRLLRPGDVAPLESVVLKMATGVVVFSATMFVFGALHLFRPGAAAVLPVLFVVADRRRVQQLRQRWHEPTRPKLELGPGAALAAAAGIVGLLIVYAGVFTPGAISCDAGWFHMSAAEDYVREGRLVPQFGDWAKALPELTSILHTWAFLVPGLRTEAHWMLGLHTEFVLFMFTLAGVVALIQYLRRREDGYGHLFGVFFLFPAIFIYDSNLGGAADHVHAFFIPPLILAALRTLERPNWRMAGLAGVAAGGAFSTKVQAVYVVAPVATLLAARALWAVVRRRDTPKDEQRQALGNLLFFPLGLLAAFAPHMIKNAIFHHNPVYPFAMAIFHGRPMVPGAARLFLEHYAPLTQGRFSDNVTRALNTLTSYSFDVHNPHPPQGLPFLGSLFTLLLPVALVARDRRIWAAIFVALSAIFSWAFAFPTPRNLQTFMPLLVAITGALMIEVWRFGIAARAALIGLVALQAVWGADQVIASQRGRIDDAMGLVTSGLDGRAKTRFQGYVGGNRALDKALPKDAVVLLHTSYQQLGINRPTILDWPGFQALIDYRPMRRPLDVYERFRQVGVTHIATLPIPAHSRQEEVVFDAFLYRHATSMGHVGDYALWAMPAVAPPAEDPYWVLCQGLDGYPDGLYRVEQLDNLDDGPRSPRAPEVPLDSAGDVVQMLPRAEAVVRAPRVPLSPEASAEINRAFERTTSYPEYEVFLRRHPPR